MGIWPVYLDTRFGKHQEVSYYFISGSIISCRSYVLYPFQSCAGAW